MILETNQSAFIGYIKDTLTMPNLHHIPAVLSPFGQDNLNHMLVPIDEPHGTIEATVER
ncbi:MAG: hypothetical protein WBM14_17135 [Terracidiphilus sp.]